MRQNGYAVFAFVTLAAFVSVGFGEVKPSVIYGEDNRLDVYEVQDAALVELSRSTVALVKTNKLQKSGDVYTLSTRLFGEQRNYCKDERFIEQGTGAFCSGFLVAPNMIATAGHCVSKYTCETTAFVFDFVMEDEKTTKSEFLAPQVYHCKKVVVSTQIDTAQDFALVELDREVENRTPLKVRTEGEIQEKEELTLVGHPSGLPLKIAGGAAVREWGSEKSFFIANTDSYGGNSGSAVLNSRTHEVEGILVRGESDFEYDADGRCTRSVVCQDDACRGEDVTNIKFVANLLPH